MQIDRYRYEHRSLPKRQAEFPPIKDLLLKQSKGKIPLTREEKIRVQKYANAKRKKRN